MAALRIVELHRGAEGGWEAVEGGTKPVHGGGAAAASPAPPPALCLEPLALLFAECLTQNSEMAAAFSGGCLTSSRKRVACLGAVA